MRNNDHDAKKKTMRRNLTVSWAGDNDITDVDVLGVPEVLENSLLRANGKNENDNSSPASNSHTKNMDHSSSIVAATLHHEYNQKECAKHQEGSDKKEE